MTAVAALAVFTTGWLITHPTALIAYGCTIAFGAFILGVTYFTSDERMAVYREYTPQELDDLIAMGARNTAGQYDPEPLTLPIPVSTVHVPGTWVVPGDGPGPADGGGPAAPAALPAPGPGQPTAPTGDMWGAA